MSEIIEEASEKEVIEDNAAYWANRARGVLVKTEKEINSASALSTLSVLDAEYSITDRYDSDEYDLFLDEFESAVKAGDNKQEVLDERIKGGEGSNSEDESE